MASYQIWLRSNKGILLADMTDHAWSWEWARLVNDVGSFTIRLKQNFSRDLVHADGRIEFWRRAVPGGPLQLELMGLARRWQYVTDERGKTTFVVSGTDHNDLLARRVVYPFATDENGNYTFKTLGTGFMDDLMRRAVARTLGSSSPSQLYTGRDITTAAQTASQGFTFAVEPEMTTSAYGAAVGQVTVDGKGDNLLELLKKIHDMSKSYSGLSGTLTAIPVFFDIALDDYNHWTFRCFKDRRGQDHRASSGQPVWIGMQYGSLVTPSWDFNRMDEFTVGFVFSNLSDPGCAKREKVDTDRANISPINYREAFAVNYDGGGEGLIAATVPHIQFQGRIVSAPGALYGSHWHFGDEVTVAYMGWAYDAKILAVHAQVGEDGTETFDVVVEVTASGGY